MNDNRAKKLTAICVCLFIAAVLFASSFLQKKQLKEEALESRKKQESLNETENVEPELYQKGEPVTIYFTNTEQIDKNGALPFRELELLNEKTQEYLNSSKIETEELSVITGSLREQGEWVYFSSRYQTGILEIGFNKITEQFDFSVREAEE